MHAAAAAHVPTSAALPAAFRPAADSLRDPAFVWSGNRGRDAKPRVLPYSIAGLLVGGLLGYLYYDRVAETPQDEDWGVGGIIYPAIGASIGVVAGTVVGQIIDRR